MIQFGEQHLVHLFGFGNHRPKIGHTFNWTGTEVSSKELWAGSPVHRRETHALEFQLKKPTIRGTLFGVVTLLALTAGEAASQSRAGTFRASPPPSGSRRATETPHPQPNVVVVPSSGGQFGGGVITQSVFPRQPVAFTLIPAILMSDGTVLADFGFGYESVTRACGNAVVMSTPTVFAGNGVILSRGTTTVTYTQPVPNQATPSQQNLPSAQSRYPILTAASQTACFARDAQGRFFVAR
jgi:hypothetical protein